MFILLRGSADFKMWDEDTKFSSAFKSLLIVSAILHTCIHICIRFNLCSVQDEFDP